MAEYKNYRKEAMAKSKEHWEMDVSKSIFSKPRKDVQQDNWQNKKDWPHTHIKVNECDH